MVLHNFQLMFVTGYTCSEINSYYYQCVPGTASGLPSTSSTKPSTTSKSATTTGSAPGSGSTSTGAGTGAGAWGSAYTKAKAALAKLSNNDKVGIVTGIGWQDGPCVGNTKAVSSISYPALCAQDSPLGIRYVQGTTAFPAGVQAAATWDTNLIYARGNALGAESKGVGVNVQLGPVAGPLGKIPQAGRNWEGFSPDPYLTGIAMSETIQGMQDAGTQACAKHFIGNEQELNRDSMSSNIDDRTLHELYLWPFADAVKANVASVMCSYNQINSSFACENHHTLSDILKGELDFQGYVMSDWNAQHTTNGAANAGMDVRTICIKPVLPPVCCVEGFNYKLTSLIIDEHAWD